MKKEYDYIANPKFSGYRSYHLVYQYLSDTQDTYNRNMLIEIQIRTRLQHLWATALETIGLFTNQALKASSGDKDILRFFCLLSSCFSIKEKMPIVPNTPKEFNELCEELKKLNSSHNYLDMLLAIKVAVNVSDGQTNSKKGYYLMILNYEKKMLNLRYYKTSDIDEATKAYNRIEANNNSSIDAVLVSVSSFNILKMAYPNYFVDLDEFVCIVKKLIII